jgi:predicted TIM-barrel fold metal-dependent hydrolase
MKIIDAHAHVIERIAGFGLRGELRPLGKGKARWANGEEIQLIPAELGDREFTGETLLALMNRFGIEKAVLLQGSFYGFQNEYAYEVATKYPEQFIAAGTLDPFCKRSGELLERWLNLMKLKVIKFETSSGGGLMGYHQPFKIDGEVFGDIFSRVAGSGATLVLDIGSPGMDSFQVNAVANIAKQYPAMKIVVCHMLAPTLKDRAALEDGLKTLQLANVWFDLAAIPANLAPEQYPYPTARDFIKLAKDIVGAEKLVWGTDVPSVLTGESYSNLIEYIIGAGIFSTAELEAVFYKNACTAYPIQPEE